MLAGRPYHADPLIQHKVSEMIAAQGAYVLTDDLVRRKDIELSGVNYLSQWSYPNRIMKSAAWVSQTGEEVQYMQLTSFGCGPDAFMTDEVQTLLRNHGKNLTLLKIDDVNNTGSLKLRVRSLVEMPAHKSRGDEELQERHRFIATLYGETCRAENHCALLHAIHIPVDTVPDETGRDTMWKTFR